MNLENEADLPLVIDGDLTGMSKNQAETDPPIEAHFDASGMSAAELMAAFQESIQRGWHGLPEDDLRDRLAILWVSERDFLILLTKGPYIRITCKLPDDAKIVSVHHEPFRRAFGIMAQSGSFRPVPDGDEIPWLEPLHFEVIAMPDN